MQAQKGARQRLVSFELEIEPAAQVFSYADSFGNAVYHFDVPQPHDGLTIIARSAVETEPVLEWPMPLDMGEWERLKSAFVRGECFDYLQPHGFTQVTRPYRRSWTRMGSTSCAAVIRSRRPGPLRHDLQGVRVRPGITDADSPIDLALEAGRGVCQDFATSCWRSAAPGACRPVMSRLPVTDREAGDRSDPDATHAWVEVFLPSYRWVGFDPTNNVMTGERHVAVAVGRDYGDVTPSRGVYKGDSESHLAVGVSVRRAGRPWPSRSSCACPPLVAVRFWPRPPRQRRRHSRASAAPAATTAIGAASKPRRRASGGPTA